MNPHLFLALLGCSAPEAPDPEPVEIAHRVAWVPAVASDRVPVATLPAEVVAMPGGAARLGPPELGRLDAWAVQPGASVEEGDVLAWLVSPALSSMEAEIAAAAAEVERARLDAEQTRAAADRGVQARSAAALAEAALAEASARHRALRQGLAARRDTTTREGNRWAWRSPTSGLVQALHCEVGALPETGGCLSLVKPDASWVLVRVPERYDTRLDRDVQGTFTAVDGRTFALTLGARAPAIDPRTRTRDTWFLTDGAAPLGASGRALVTAASWDGVTTIPEPGLTRVDGEPVVMRRVGEATRAEVTAVQVVGRAPDVVHVTGLDTGDEVAVRGVFLLKSLALLEGTGESE